MGATLPVRPFCAAISANWANTLLTTMAPVLIKKAANLAKGSGVPNREKVGKVTREQVREIVKLKQADINAVSEAAAMRIIEGTARSMGIEVE